MKPKFSFAMLALGLTMPFALQAAEVASTTLSVTATVLERCILTAPAGLVFASVNTGVVTNQTVQGTVSVVCMAAKPSVTIKLEGGDNAACSSGGGGGGAGLYDLRADLRQSDPDNRHLY